jgi:hypothetical protein
MLRQVLQHLSNRQIQAILPKLARYRWVIVTEHLPSERSRVVANLDKVHGSHVRIADRSGVYLDQPPFSLPANSMRTILEMPGVGMPDGVDPGIIRTILVRMPGPP